MTARSRPTRRRVRAGSILLILVGCSLIGSNSVSAQDGGQLDLVDQTLVVDDEPVEIVVRVTGAPESSRIQVTVFERPIVTLAAVRSSHDRAPTTAPASPSSSAGWIASVIRPT